MKLQVQSIPVDFFTYNKNTRSFVCEMSELQGNRYDVFGRLFNDAMDCGFNLYNEKRGTSAEFVFVREFCSADGSEVDGWEFEPSNETLCKHPRLINHKVVVFND